MFEPVIAIAASPRDWANRLRRQVVDHGGARLRATVLHQEDALDESFEVLIVDDTTSFLSQRLVMQLQNQGRRVLGVYGDLRGCRELLSLGVDHAVEAATGIEELLAAVSELAERAKPAQDMAPMEPLARGRITAVGGSVGGCGTTEIAIGLAAALGSRGGRVVLVDGDEVAPSVAPRLGLTGGVPPLIGGVPPDPLTAPLTATLIAPLTAPFSATPTPAGWSPARVLPGASSPEIRPAGIATVIRQLASHHDHVVVDIGHLAGHTRPGHVLVELADAVVAVGVPTPVGFHRMFDWLAQASVLAASVPVHLVLNHAPGRRGDLARQLGWCPVASLTTIPFDRRVRGAACARKAVEGGRFARALDALVIKVCSSGEEP